MGTDPTDAYEADVRNYLKALGQNVRTLREAVSPPLSQERLAHITGLHRTEISKIEQGRVDPRQTTLHRVAHALNATLNDLARGLPVPPQRDPWGHYKRGEVTPTEPMRRARTLTEEVMRLARELLQAGAELAHVQTDYTIAAIEMLGAAEALEALATSGDQDARGALDGTLSKLVGLRDRARRERDQGRSDGQRP
jgi:transcriptional regulator with XRE-family HTH domain